MSSGEDLLTPLWRQARPATLTAAQWELLLAQARTARLGPRVAAFFDRDGWRETVPAVVWPHLRSAQRYAELLRRQVRFEADRISMAVQGLEIPVLFLKGAAYVLAELPAAQGRLFSDIDILVPMQHLRAAERALLAAGWIPEKLTPYDDRYYRQWMHELPPLRHVARPSYLDVHHTIAPPTSRYPVDGARLFAAAPSKVDATGRPAVLHPCDMVLHSALHLMSEGEFSAGLRDLLDLRDLVDHFAREAGFSAALLRRADELGLSRPLAHVLVQLRRLLGRPVLQGEEVQAFIRKEVSGPSARLVTLLLRHALKPHHPSCDDASVRLARWALYVRSHWLRMPWYQIVPHLLRKAWTRAWSKVDRIPPDRPAAPQ